MTLGYTADLAVQQPYHFLVALSFVILLCVIGTLIGIGVDVIIWKIKGLPYMWRGKIVYPKRLGYKGRDDCMYP